MREGSGLSFFYFAPSSSLVRVPLASCDVPFIFSEVTADFQEVSIQGQLTYRVADARRLAEMMNFSVLPNGQYAADAPEKLPQRLVNLTQVTLRAHLSTLPLKQALGAADRLVPEIQATLQAEAEKSVQRQQRELQEAEMATKVALEERNRQLVSLAAENARTEADAKAYGISTAMRALGESKPELLQALANAGMEPGQLIALAFKELATGADKIGQLNVSPDLLRELLAAPAKR